jgi:hypothetical protein
MPKKKLTKAQVNKKMQTVRRALYDLFLDKLGQLKSDVPMSQAKILDVHRQITNAEKRM